MKRTEEEQRLRKWVYGQTTALRVEAKAAIERGRIGDSLLLDKIRSNVVDADFLYRGVVSDPDDSRLSLVAGNSFQLLPCSFSRDHQIASRFFRGKKRSADDVPVLLLLQRSEQPIRGFDLAAYFGTNAPLDSAWQREVITAGVFKLLNQQPLHDGRLLVIQQIGVYGVQ